MSHNHALSHLSQGWRWSATIIFFLSLFFLLLLLHHEAKSPPPLPSKVISEEGKTLFTNEDILRGQKLFFRHNLMHLGSLFGHGSLFGVDFTAEELHREAGEIQEYLSLKQYQQHFAFLDDHTAKMINASVSDHFHNQINPKTTYLTYTQPRAMAFEKSQTAWKKYFSQLVGKDVLDTDQELFELTAFFSWSGFVASSIPAGGNVSYTHNFPFDSLIGNLPPSDLLLTSAIAILVLFGVLTCLLYLFGKYDFWGWGIRKTAHLHSLQFSSREQTAGQRGTAKYLVLVSSLFLFQTISGIFIGHFRAESAFWKSSIASLFPFTLLNSWHAESGLFWILTAWIAGTLYLALIFSKEEAALIRKGIHVLFVLLLFTFTGSFVGEFLATHHLLPNHLWTLIGTQGVPFFGFGRLFQILFLGALSFWIVLLFFCLKPGFKTSSKEKKELGSLFFLSAFSLPLVYVPSLFLRDTLPFPLFETFRLTTLHLWFEGFFQLFLAIFIALLFSLLGFVSLKSALRLSYLSAILFLGAGILSTAHHLYFVGISEFALITSSLFSALEIIPLTLLALMAFDFLLISKGRCIDCTAYLERGTKYAFFFFIACGVWNVIGSGLFGLITHLPLLAYYANGTSLIMTHEQATLIGVFGMMALGIFVFIMRSSLGNRAWKRIHSYVKAGFVGVNLGLFLLIAIDLLPAGILQLNDVIKEGYFHARSLDFHMQGSYHVMEEIRTVADVIFLAVGVIPLFVASLIGYFAIRKEKV